MSKPDIETAGGGAGAGNELSAEEISKLLSAFIWKMYSCFVLQMLLYVADLVVLFFVRPIRVFITETNLGMVVYFVILFLPLLLLWPLYAFEKKHPIINCSFISIITISMSFLVGIWCSFLEERIILVAAILTVGIVLAILGIAIYYTIRAVKRGHDFSFLRPFLSFRETFLFRAFLVCAFLLILHITYFGLLYKVEYSQL